MGYPPADRKLWPPNRLLWAAIVYCCAIGVLSHLPGDEIPTIVIWDKAVHFLEYIPLGLLLTGWLILRSGPGRRLVVLYSVLGVAMLGGIDEIHQAFVPGRVPSGFDLIADVLGGLVGSLIGVPFFSMMAKRRAVQASR